MECWINIRDTQSKKGFELQLPSADILSCTYRIENYCVLLGFQVYVKLSAQSKYYGFTKLLLKNPPQFSPAKTVPMMF